MTPQFLIRPATLADVRSIWTIERLSFPAPWSRWNFLIELKNPSSTMLVAGPLPPRAWETFGYLIYWLVAGEMHILNLAVHPRHRRQGVAQALLAQALTQGRAAGATMAWLEVRPSNSPALALYDSFGFKEVGSRPKYYADNQEDALILALSWEEEGS